MKYYLRVRKIQFLVLNKTELNKIVSLMDKRKEILEIVHHKIRRLQITGQGRQE